MESCIDTGAYYFASSSDSSLECARSESPTTISDGARFATLFGRREFRRKGIRRFLTELVKRGGGLLIGTCPKCKTSQCTHGTCAKFTVYAYITPSRIGDDDDCAEAPVRIASRFTRSGSFEPSFDLCESHSRNFWGVDRVYADEFQATTQFLWGKWSIQLRVSISSEETVNFHIKYDTQTGLNTIVAMIASSLPTEWVKIAAEMDVMETEKGVVNDESTRNENTIITRDAALAVSTEDSVPLAHVSTTERVHTMDDLVGRWVPLPSFEWNLSDAEGKLIQTLYLPEYLYSQVGHSVNMLPFRTFIYSDFDLEIRFKVNANKFQCGKLLAAVKHDSYQADGIASLMESAFLRTNVEIDVPACNEGQLNIPFIFHRPYVRNIITNLTNGHHSVRCGKTCTVNVFVLSRLSTGPNGLGTAVVRPFIRFSRANFAGMSFQQELRAEMEYVAVDLLGRCLEKQLNFQGGHNHDKPSDPRSSRVMPSVSGLLTHTVGPAILTPLRADPTQTTPQTAPRSSNDPKTVYDIAKQYGLWARFDWSSSNSPGTLLFSAEIDPNRRSFRAGDNDVTQPRSYVPTPLEYVSSIYSMWSGTIKVRLDFVSTAFHSGTIMIAAEFNRLGERSLNAAPPANSGYTKTFELGDQRSVEFTIPYIYDTVARRTTGTVWSPLVVATADIIRKTGDWLDSSTVSPVTTSYLNVYVINQLRPIPEAPQKIEVLAYIAAGEDMRFAGLKQSHLYTAPRLALDDFPREYKVKGLSRSKRDTDDKVPRVIAPGKYLPITIRNAWNEYLPSALPAPNAGVEMDSTEDFQPGPPRMHVLGEDRDTDIKDILRRPTVLLDQYTVRPWRPDLYNLFIPLTPPTNYFNIEDWTYTTHPSRHILSLFRFWRGSMRYTVFVDSIDCPPHDIPRVHVSVLPHSGTRIVGNQGMYANAPQANKESLWLRPVWASGCATDVILPMMNPMGQFEVPHISENTWSLMVEESCRRSYSWRDKGDTNSGHLVITTSHAAKITVWWAAGDDFEVSNMYGCPEITTVQDETCISEKYTELVNADEAAQPVNASKRADTNEVGTIRYRRQVGDTVEEFIPTPSIRAELAINLPDLQSEVVAMTKREVGAHVLSACIYIAEAVLVAGLPPPFNTLLAVPIISSGTELWSAITGKHLPESLIRIRTALNIAVSVTSVGVIVWQGRVMMTALPNVVNSVYQPTTVPILTTGLFDQFCSILYLKPELIFTGIAGGYLYLTPDLLAAAAVYNANARRKDPNFGMTLTEISREDKMALIQARKRYASAMSNMRAEMGLTVKHTIQGPASDALTAAAGEVSGQVAGMAEEFSATNEQAREVISNVDRAVEEIRTRTGECSEHIRSMLTMVSQKVGHFFDGTTGMIQVAQDFIVDLTIALLTGQWLIMASTLVRTILKILGITLSETWDYIKRLASSIKHWLMPGMRAESDTMLYGVLAALVSIAFKVKLTAQKGLSFGKAIEHTIADGRSFSTMNSAMSFVERTFEQLSALIIKALGLKSSSSTILKLMCENDSYVSGFVRNAQRIMSEYNEDKLGDIDVRNFVLGVHVTALHIQSALLSATIPGMGPLLTFTREFLDWCREHSMDMSCSPLRGVPYCLQIDGPSGIGKSRTAPELVDALLKAADIHTNSSEMIYTRSPGAKFWDGYRRQPVIQYDDAFNLRDAEHVSNTVNELYQLMTNAPFRPNKADLSEKKLYGNPALVLLLTNEPFPMGIHNASVCPEAVMRRRDIMISARWAPGWDRERLKANGSTNFEHLYFVIWKDPTNKDKGFHHKQYTWAEMVELLKEKFKTHWEKERLYVAKEFRRLQARLQNKPLEEVNLIDPYAMFYSTMYTDMDDYHPADVNLPLDHLQILVEQAMPQIMEVLKDREIRAEGPTAGTSALIDGTYLADGMGQCNKCHAELPQTYRCMARHKICADCASATRNHRCPMCTSLTSKLIPISLTPVVIPVLQYMVEFGRNVKTLEKHLIAKFKMTERGARQCIADVLQWVQGHSPWGHRMIEGSSRGFTISGHREFLKRKPLMTLEQCCLQGIENPGRIGFYANDRWLFAGEDTCQHPDAPCSATCLLRDHEFATNMLREFIERNALDLELHRELKDDSHVPFMLRTAEYKLPFYKKWWHYLSDFWKRHKMALIAVSGILSLLTAIVSIFSLVKPEPIAAENSPYPDSLPNIRVSSKYIRKAPNWKFKAEMEESVDPAITNKVMTNWVIVRVYKDELPVVHCVIQGMVSHYAIMPKHYYERFKEVMNSKDVRMTLQPVRYSAAGLKHMEVSHTFDPCDFTIIADSDLAVMKLPANTPLFSDIRKYFSTHDDMTQGLPSEGQVFCVPTSREHVPTIQKVKIMGYSEQQTFNSEDGKVMARDVITYNFAGSGKCGSILAFARSARPLYGMHIAGNGINVGYSMLVTQELLEDILPAILVREHEVAEYDDIPDTLPLFAEGAHVEYHGIVQPKMEVHIPRKSKIIPSEIQALAGLQPHYQPAILHKSDARYQHTRDPLWYGCSKHGIQSDNFSSSVIQLAATAIWDKFFSVMAPVYVGPKRDDYVAACRPKVHEFYDGLKLNTSAGYPWTKYNQSDTSKAHWVTVDEDNHVIGLHPMLMATLDKKEKLRRQGVVTDTVFVDTLKDERLPQRKILKAGGTRVFCASPIDQTIAMRQNFNHFCAAMMKARLAVGSAVGINPHSREWGGLARHLLQVGRKVFTIDYSNFGPSFNACVAQAFAEIMVRWSEEHVEGFNATEGMALLYEVLQSKHIMKNLVYSQYSGSPSGAAITTIINSGVNLIYIMVAWIEIMRVYFANEGGLLEAFFEHVRVVVYGDDLIASVSDAYAECFNATTITQFFATYKIVATDASKHSEVTAWTTLQESSFLKRGFDLHPKRTGEYLAPLKWESVEDCSQWIWRADNTQEATRVNAAMALMECHAHYKEFPAFKKKLNKALGLVGIEPVTDSWEYLDNLWYREGFPIFK